MEVINNWIVSNCVYIYVATPSCKSSEMPELRVLFIGLDNAGKTTLCARILSRLNVNIAPNDTLVPTIGVEAHIAKLSNYVYKVFDMGGSGHFRSLW